MNSLSLFGTQAAYNKWINTHLYSLCDRIEDNERRRNAGAFFGSIHGTLNHLLLVDRLWLGRFRQIQFDYDSLDQELFADYEELKQERGVTDRLICDYIEGLREVDLDSPITFVSRVTGREHTIILSRCLLHFFHHQTHHRGQITTLISQLGIDIGVTDLLWMPDKD